MAETINEKVNKQTTKYTLWLTLAALFLFCFLVAGFLTLLVQLPEGSISKGVSIGPIDVGGLNTEQARKLIVQPTDAILNKGIIFEYKDVSLNLPSVADSSINPDVSATIFDYDLDKTVTDAFQVGRGGNRMQKALDRLYARFFGIKIPLEYSLSMNEANKFLHTNLAALEVPNKNASLKIEDGEILKVTAVAESAGKIFDYDKAVQELKNNLGVANSDPIILRLIESQPEVFKTQAEKLQPLLVQALSGGKIILISGDKQFEIPAKEWGQWVILKNIEGKVGLAIEANLLEEYLKKQVDYQLETQFEEARFIVENGRVKEFKPGQAGEKVNVPALVAAVEKALFDGGERKIELVKEIVEPELSLAKVNDFGIKELLGEGQTNFKGSPVNRRKNIAVGAAALNGILIKPGETLSVIERLRPIDNTNGYLPELVIKGNKTKPEFGGGLCQVSTTIFRAVLAAGLPVVERANHAYRVSYYEPPVGIDATIYDPEPDFKFINDTANYILIQTKIEGDNLFFQFWGTKDGRSVRRTDPKVYNIKSPPPSKLVETLDLPVGQKKCTEKAHAGADASFTYTVAYGDGTIKTQDFVSRYRPWGEVCMIGVEKLSEPAAVDGVVSATSTAPNNNASNESVAPVIPVPPSVPATPIITNN